MPGLGQCSAICLATISRGDDTMTPSVSPNDGDSSFDGDGRKQREPYKFNNVFAIDTESTSVIVEPYRVSIGTFPIL